MCVCVFSEVTKLLTGLRGRRTIIYRKVGGFGEGEECNFFAGTHRHHVASWSCLLQGGNLGIQCKDSEGHRCRRDKPVLEETK